VTDKLIEQQKHYIKRQYSNATNYLLRSLSIKGQESLSLEQRCCFAPAEGAIKQTKINPKILYCSLILSDELRVI
jgi:hypothetical protein